MLFLYWGVGWFGGLVFVAFWGFCRVLPVRTVSILRVLNFLVLGCIVQLETSAALIFIFLKALEWMPVFIWCNCFFDFVVVFFEFSLAFTIDFFIN